MSSPPTTSITPHQKNFELRNQVPIDQIIINPNQPRKFFNSESLQELADSIVQLGLIHPPTVRRIKNSLLFELISGERRWRASKLAGLKNIPVLILESDSLESAELALVENLQRVDLNPIEIALAIQRIIEEHSLTQQELSYKIGKNRSTIANYLRLLSLPLDIQSKISQQSISMGHAKALLMLPNPEDQKDLLQRIEIEGLNVRQAEKFAAQIQRKTKKDPSQLELPFERKDPHLEGIIRKLEYVLGTKVAIHPRNGDKGIICIDYYSWDDLEKITQLLDPDFDSAD